mmetsp:Transcript_6662/g.14569  ORF Transcript_6662/g.14569 Transcript_6662/m.14569 type:complete len:89 (+) Transcript_6662:67-333(+)
MAVLFVARKSTSDIFSSSGNGGRGKGTRTPRQRLCKVLFRGQEQTSFFLTSTNVSAAMDITVVVCRQQLRRRGGGGSGKYIRSDDKLQ